MKQRGLCQRVNNKSTARALLSGFMERLPWRRNYLGAYINDLALLKTHYRLLQKQSKKVNSNFSPRWYGSINSEAHGGFNKKTWSTCKVYHHYHHYHQASKKVLDLFLAWSFPVFFSHLLFWLEGFLSSQLFGFPP